MTTVLVTRSDDKFSSTLREAGFNVVNLELIETKPLDDLSELQERLAKLPEYDGIFLTSPVAADVFVRERKGSNGFYGNVYALGKRAQNVLEAAGLNVKIAREANTADEMLNDFGEDEFAGKRFLFIRGEKSLRTIPKLLGGRAVVDEVVVYRTETSDICESTIEDVRSRLSNAEIDFICFFSPSGVERFYELFQGAAKVVKAAAVGSTTAEKARERELNVHFVSPRSDAEYFAKSLIAYINGGK